MSNYTKSNITRIGSHSWDYWKVSECNTNGTNGFEIHYSDDGECITDHVYTKADADLIAAAPLMYETLKCILDLSDSKIVTNYINKALSIAEGNN